MNEIDVEKVLSNFIKKDIEDKISDCIELENDKIYLLADELAKEGKTNLLLYKTLEGLSELFVNFLNERSLEKEIKVYFSKLELNSTQLQSGPEDNEKEIKNIEYTFLIKLYENFTPETFSESFKKYIEDFKETFS